MTKMLDPYELKYNKFFKAIQDDHRITIVHWNSKKIKTYLNNPTFHLFEDFENCFTKSLEFNYVEPITLKTFKPVGSIEIK